MLTIGLICCFHELIIGYICDHKHHSIYNNNIYNSVKWFKEAIYITSEERYYATKRHNFRENLNRALSLLNMCVCVHVCVCACVRACVCVCVKNLEKSSIFTPI